MKTTNLLATLISLSLSSLGLQAQGLQISNGAFVQNTGAAHIIIHDGDFENNGTFQAGQSTVELTGNSNSAIQGSTTTTFSNLDINKSTNNAMLAQAIQVDDNLMMNGGNLDLNGNNLTLGSANGTIVGESETTRITDNIGGEILKTVTLNAPAAANPGNIGLALTSANNLGNTIIRRGHTPSTLPTGTSVHRYFYVTAANSVGVNPSIRMFYFDAELNGLTETDIEPWYNSSSWQALNSSGKNATLNFVDFGNSNDLSAKYTLGTPLVTTVESFEGKDWDINLFANSPNSTTPLLVIEGPESKDFELKLVNNLGQVLQNNLLQHQYKSQQTIEMSNYAAGTYHLSLQSTDGKIKKVISIIKN